MFLSYLTLAKACSWIYGSFKISDNWEILMQTNRVGLLKIDNYCVFVNIGTNSLSDVIVDVESFGKPGGCYNEEYYNRHLIFYYQMHFKPKIVDALADYWHLCKPHNTIITGHSLGGSMAAIAGSDLNISEIITFGEPRSCCPGKLNKYENEITHTRIVNGDHPILHDPIPSIHGLTNNIHCPHSTVRWTKNINYIDKRADSPTNGNDIFIEMHRISSYITNLENYKLTNSIALE